MTMMMRSGVVGKKSTRDKQEVAFFATDSCKFPTRKWGCSDQNIAFLKKNTTGQYEKFSTAAQNLWMWTRGRVIAFCFSPPRRPYWCGWADAARTAWHAHISGSTAAWLEQQFPERFAKLDVEDGVDERVEEAVDVAEPDEEREGERMNVAEAERAEQVVADAHSTDDVDREEWDPAEQKHTWTHSEQILRQDTDRANNEWTATCVHEMCFTLVRYTVDVRRLQ